MSHAYYTQANTEVIARNENKLYDRYQADYDYNGSIDTDGDSADYFRPVRAVKVG